MKPLSSALLVLALAVAFVGTSAAPSWAAPAKAAPRTAAGQAAQRKTIYRDSRGDNSVQANSGNAEFVGADFKTVRFAVAGNVLVSSRSQGLGATAARMTGVVEPDPARKGAQRLDELKASGGVTILRTRTETVGGKAVTGRTDAKGDSATYKAGANDSGTATLVGNVVIVDDLGARKVNMTGDNGTANFSTAQRGNSALKGATMTGNVRIKVTQVDSAGAARVYNASGDRLTYANAGTSGTVTLTGDVKLDSPGEGGGVVEGVRRLVLTLNANGELTRVQSFTEDPVAKVRTIFRPKSAGAKNGTPPNGASTNGAPKTKTTPPPPGGDQRGDAPR